MKIAILGCGNMGLAFARSFVQYDLVKKENLFLIEKNKMRCEMLYKLQEGVVVNDIDLERFQNATLPFTLNDILGKGFAARWLLQHHKGKKPFRTKMKFIVNLIRQVMIKVSFFFGFLCLMLMACHKKPNGPMTFEELTIDVSKGRYTYNDTIKRRIRRVFIVDNFCFCPKDVLTFDSLFCTFVYDRTYSYSVGLFKKSEITNIDHLQKFPRDLDRHSSQNDRILSYIHNENDYHFYRYDCYIDEVNILSIRNKFICNEGRAVPYTDGYK